MKTQRRKDVLRWPMLLLKITFQHPLVSNIFLQRLVYGIVIAIDFYHLYYVYELFTRSETSREKLYAFEGLTSYMHVKYQSINLHFSFACA